MGFHWFDVFPHPPPSRLYPVAPAGSTGCCVIRSNPFVYKIFVTLVFLRAVLFPRRWRRGLYKRGRHEQGRSGK